VTNRQFLSRMLMNLKGSYWRREEWGKVVAVIDRLLLLNPTAASEWRDRGIAWTHQGETARQIKGHLRRMRHKLARLN
jgi:regulator of sirC expression with transglutaminase-like and TPR domain